MEDDAGEPTYIETVARRGYRFLPSPEFLPEDGGKSFRSRITPWAAVAVLAIGIALAVYFNNGSVDDGSGHAETQLAWLESPGYEDFLFGQHALARGDPGIAENQLRKAIELDPSLAPAYVALGRALVLQRAAGWGNIVEAQDLVDRALRLEPELAAAHVLNAGLALYYWRDRDAARKAAEKARKLAPGASDSYVVSAYLLTVEGRFDEAIDTITKAHEISPLSPNLNADYGWVHYKARNWTDAERLCRTSVELNPKSSFALECIIHVNHSQGDHAEAADFGLKLMALRGADEADIAAIRELADARARERAYWNWTYDWARRHEKQVSDAHSKQGIALTMLGRLDEAVKTLDAGFEEKGEPFLAFVAVDPRVDELRTHDDFEALAARSREPVLR